MKKILIPLETTLIFNHLPIWKNQGYLKKLAIKNKRNKITTVVIDALATIYDLRFESFNINF